MLRTRYTTKRLIPPRSATLKQISALQHLTTHLIEVVYPNANAPPQPPTPQPSTPQPPTSQPPTSQSPPSQPFPSQRPTSQPPPSQPPTLSTILSPWTNFSFPPETSLPTSRKRSRSASEEDEEPLRRKKARGNPPTAATAPEKEHEVISAGDTEVTSEEKDEVHFGGETEVISEEKEALAAEAVHANDVDDDGDIDVGKAYVLPFYWRRVAVLVTYRSLASTLNTGLCEQLHLDFQFLPLSPSPPPPAPVDVTNEPENTTDEPDDTTAMQPTQQSEWTFTR
ncbi:MAG: hypothetical protein Q9198_000515 [Flavoplaca austrocitrina]